jgi:hypothetical protein
MAYKPPIDPKVFGIGLAIVLVAAAGVVWMQWGAHVDLKGQVLKVRTQGMDDGSSIAVVDFRFVNPSDVLFVVRDVTVSIEDKDGNKIDGATVSDVDANRLFQYYPVLGQKFNDSLLMKAKIAPKESLDRMIAARFEVPQEKLDSRRRLIVRIEDVDGPVAEIGESRLAP